MKTKTDIRNTILNMRDSMETSDRDYLNNRVKNKLLAMEEVKKASVIMTYVSFRSEVDTIDIIEELLAQGKKIAVPKVNGEDMHFYLIESVSELSKGFMGILEPNDDIVDKGEYIPVNSDVMLVPGAVFDRLLYRIGYGKGYYDRYLKKYKKIHTIGLGYHFQVVDRVPIDTWDKCLEMVVTEKEVIVY